jgi:uncharacterized protein
MMFAVALGLGFFSSLHCLAMCGPIALALPVHQLAPLQRILSVSSYNLARCTSYAIMGTITGAVGQTFAAHGLQSTVCVLTGTIMLLFVILHKSKIPALLHGKFPGRALLFIRNNISSALSVRSKRSVLTVGLLNGLLPCGVSLMALTAAVATGSALSGAAFMFAFGLGTAPAMFALPLVRGIVTVETRRKMLRSVPVAICITSVFMILRGMNLGIPYVSPDIGDPANHCNSSNQTSTIQCTGHNSHPVR